MVASAARARRCVLATSAAMAAVLPLLVHITYRITYSPLARQRMAARHVEDGGHPLAAAVISSSTLPPPPGVHDRTEEPSWPCMAPFAGLQERHVFTMESWATPPSRWLLADLAASSTVARAAPPPQATNPAPGLLVRPRVIIAGIARDIPPEQLRAIIPRLEKLGQSQVFADYHLVIYENDSPADSRHALCDEMAAASPKAR